MRYIRPNITRRKLPNRRQADTRSLESQGLPFTATFGHFADGSVGEIFLQNHKPGSQADANARMRLSPRAWHCNTVSA